MALPRLAVGSRPIDIIINDHCIRYIEIKPSNPSGSASLGRTFFTSRISEGRQDY
ncbi:hypothetical protein [Bacillus sp. T3]|uniref:hypothetical protein n=1 Tax=Bacillus sp. T3 TaxID=467262 RepID=UPI002980ABDE|nr:hypothetical protein [Bacillus sp. T3]